MENMVKTVEDQGIMAQAVVNQEEEYTVERESFCRRQVAWLAAMTALAEKVRELANEEFECNWSNSYTDLSESLYMMTLTDHLDKDLQAAFRTLTEGFLDTPQLDFQKQCLDGLCRMFKATYNAERAAYMKKYCPD